MLIEYEICLQYFGSAVAPAKVDLLNYFGNFTVSFHATTSLRNFDMSPLIDLK